MRRRTKIIIASILSLGAIGGVAATQLKDGCGWRGDRAAHVLSKVSKELDLTAAQQEQLQILTDQFKEARNSFRDHRQQRHLEIVSLLDSDTLDRDKAFEMFEQSQQKLEQRAQVMIAAMADFTDALDTEQRTRLRELIEKRSRWNH